MWKDKRLKEHVGQTESRKLAATMFTDMVGFSRQFPACAAKPETLRLFRPTF